MAEIKKVMADLSVRFRDVDAMGHVNNAVFFTYFEEGRKAFLKEVFDIVDIADYPFILAHLSCDYLKPVRLGDTLRLEIWIGEIGNKTFSFLYRVTDRHQSGVAYAKGKSIMVLYDYRQEQTVPVSQEFRQKLSPYLENPSS